MFFLISSKNISKKTIKHYFQAQAKRADLIGMDGIMHSSQYQMGT